jgi:hypothetical protein
VRQRFVKTGTTEEPTSGWTTVELFCLNGHKLELQEIGRQMVEQLRKADTSQ